MWHHFFLLNCDKYIEVGPVFPILCLLVRNFRQIPKYFVEACDCMTAAFINYGCTLIGKQTKKNCL